MSADLQPRDCRHVLQKHCLYVMPGLATMTGVCETSREKPRLDQRETGAIYVSADTKRPSTSRSTTPWRSHYPASRSTARPITRPFLMFWRARDWDGSRTPRQHSASALYRSALRARHRSSDVGNTATLLSPRGIWKERKGHARTTPRVLGRWKLKRAIRDAHPDSDSTCGLSESVERHRVLKRKLAFRR